MAFGFVYPQKPIGDLIWVKDEDDGKIYFMMELDIENPEDITKMNTVTLKVKKHKED